MVIEILLCILILAILVTASYYAAHKWVALRHNRDVIADELKRATDHIEELEARVMMLEAERETQANMMDKRHRPEGYEVFSMRG